MKKTIKKISAVLAAVMCSAVIMASPVSAAEYSVGEEVSVVAEAYANKQSAGYKEAVKLIGVKYNSSFEKKVAGYMNKTSKTKVTYKKSRTNKVLSKMTKRSEAIAAGDKDAVKKGMSIAMVGKDTVIYIGIKDDKSAVIMQSDAAGLGMGMYADSKSSTITNLDTKEKMTVPVEEGSSSSDSALSSDPTSAYLLEDDAEGSVFKFKGKNDSYTLEVFEIEGEKGGFLFNSKGTLIGLYDDVNGYMTVKMSLSPKSSTLKVPSGYKEMDMSSLGQ